MTDNKKTQPDVGEAPGDAIAAEQPAAGDFESKYLRALADLDNMRKRTEREIDALRKYSSESLILDIIRSIEDLERAVAEGCDGESEGVQKGVDMILADLKSTLERNGVRAIDTSGNFDPALHEAMMQECPDCAEDDGKIAEVLQSGYMLHDKVIRHAKVKVYKFTENKKR